MSKSSARRSSRGQELTAIALDLFAKRGFAHVSMKEIARKAGINPALIYYYFDDKADLFRATIVHAVSIAHEQYLQLRTKHEDPMGRINAWFESNELLAHRIQKLMTVMLAYANSDVHFPGIDVAIREFYELERMILAESIRRGIHDGIFLPTDPDRLATLISVHLDGIMVASSIRKNFDLGTALADVKALLGRCLGLEDAEMERAAINATSSGAGHLSLDGGTTNRNPNIGGGN